MMGVVIGGRPVLRRSKLRSLASPLAFVTGLFVLSLASFAHAIPSCPAGATLITTNQSFVTPHSGVTCVVAGVSVSVDIQAYQTATIFTEADVGVDVEAYTGTTIHVLGGTIGADIDDYDGTINVFQATVLGHVASYGGSVNLYGGDIAGPLYVFAAGRINLFASSLSNHPFGDIAEPAGMIEGTFGDGSAFALDFHRNSAGVISLIAIPEPDTFALLGLATGGMALGRRWNLRRPR
jgi:hypothetical protein